MIQSQINNICMDKTSTTAEIFGLPSLFFPHGLQIYGLKSVFSIKPVLDLICLFFHLLKKMKRIPYLDVFDLWKKLRGRRRRRWRASSSSSSLSLYLSLSFSLFSPFLSIFFFRTLFFERELVSLFYRDWVSLGGDTPQPPFLDNSKVEFYYG